MWTTIHYASGSSMAYELRKKNQLLIWNTPADYPKLSIWIWSKGGPWCIIQSVREQKHPFEKDKFKNSILWIYMYGSCHDIFQLRLTKLHDFIVVLKTWLQLFPEIRVLNSRLFRSLRAM